MSANAERILELEQEIRDLRQITDALPVGFLADAEQFQIRAGKTKDDVSVTYPAELGSGGGSTSNLGHQYPFVFLNGNHVFERQQLPVSTQLVTNLGDGYIEPDTKIPVWDYGRRYYTFVRRRFRFFYGTADANIVDGGTGTATVVFGVGTETNGSTQLVRNRALGHDITSGDRCYFQYFNDERFHALIDYTWLLDLE